jgi:L-2,4-diaminobutyric acid acetyltransferase
MIDIVMIFTPLTIRSPNVEDGRALHGLIAECPPLDLNSPYAYLIFCKDFADTCVVASDSTGLIGAITAYRPQRRQDTLFVWQVAVAPAYRGQGLAHRMLRSLLHRPALRRIAYVEATVGPGNAASRGLFAGLAKERGVNMATSPLFTDEQLGAGHEPEVLHRVGPLQVNALREAV